MRLNRTTILTGLLAIFLINLASDAIGADRRRGSCRKGDRIRILDLDMSPDPIVQGQRIRVWKVRIRLEGRRDCETEIEIRDGDEVIARKSDYSLRPGVNEIEIRPEERYRFHGREHCFNVVVDLEGTWRRTDADRKFCARQKPAWSMGERRDRERGFR